jgi:hypothetical protein
LSATNGQGFEIQAYCHWTGWRRVSKVFATQDEARAAMAAWPGEGVQLRVYESLA